MASPASASVSSSVSSTAAAASSSSTACASTTLSQFPTKDAACAVSGVKDNYNDILKGCCKTAPVESLDNGCWLWCLSVDQSIGDLQKCWQDGGVSAGSIQCNQVSNATATEKPSSTGGSGSKETSSKSGSASGSATSSADKPGAAMVVAPQGVSKAGLGMLVMVLGSAVFGAML